MITKALILTYYKQDFRTIVETDSSNYVNNRVFFSWIKIDYYILLHFYLNSTEYNYEIYDKELLSIIRSFK